MPTITSRREDVWHKLPPAPEKKPKKLKVFKPVETEEPDRPEMVTPGGATCVRCGKKCFNGRLSQHWVRFRNGWHCEYCRHKRFFFPKKVPK